ncbi:unnamed protein product [Amoebophrya sp. A25]|nr:unnamed protein product [Amoebophrya sp. A25]|eukprot:GSA25T00010932001.1
MPSIALPHRHQSQSSVVSDAISQLMSRSWMGPDDPGSPSGLQNTSVSPSTSLPASGKKVVVRSVACFSGAWEAVETAEGRNNSVIVRVGEQRNFSVDDVVAAGASVAEDEQQITVQSSEWLGQLDRVLNPHVERLSVSDDLGRTSAIVAYGARASGKTSLLFGGSSQTSKSKTEEQRPGMIARAVDLFLQQSSLDLCCSLIAIWGDDRLQDLFVSGNRTTLSRFEAARRVRVKGSEELSRMVREAMEVHGRGNLSGAHAVLTLHIAPAGRWTTSSKGVLDPCSNTNTAEASGAPGQDDFTVFQASDNTIIFTSAGAQAAHNEVTTSAPGDPAVGSETLISENGSSASCKARNTHHPHPASSSAHASSFLRDCSFVSTTHAGSPEDEESSVPYAQFQSSSSMLHFLDLASFRHGYAEGSPNLREQQNVGSSARDSRRGSASPTRVNRSLVALREVVAKLVQQKNKTSWEVNRTFDASLLVGCVDRSTAHQIAGRQSPSSKPPVLRSSKSYVPFRNSKLTQFLRPALLGWWETTTFLLCCRIEAKPSGRGPVLDRDTMETLRFGESLRSLRARPFETNLSRNNSGFSPICVGGSSSPGTTTSRAFAGGARRAGIRRASPVRDAMKLGLTHVAVTSEGPAVVPEESVHQKSSALKRPSIGHAAAKPPLGPTVFVEISSEQTDPDAVEKTDEAVDDRDARPSFMPEPRKGRSMGSAAVYSRDLSPPRGDDDPDHREAGPRKQRCPDRVIIPSRLLVPPSLPKSPSEFAPEAPGVVAPPCTKCNNTTMVTERESVSLGSSVEEPLAGVANHQRADDFGASLAERIRATFAERAETAGGMESVPSLKRPLEALTPKAGVPSGHSYDASHDDSSNHAFDDRAVDDTSSMITDSARKRRRAAASSAGGVGAMRLDDKADKAVNGSSPFGSSNIERACSSSTSSCAAALYGSAAPLSRGSSSRCVVLEEQNCQILGSAGHDSSSQLCSSSPFGSSSSSSDEQTSSSSSSDGCYPRTRSTCKRQCEEALLAGREVEVDELEEDPLVAMYEQDFAKFSPSEALGIVGSEIERIQVRDLEAEQQNNYNLVLGASTTGSVTPGAVGLDHGSGEKNLYFNISTPPKQPRRSRRNSAADDDFCKEVKLAESEIGSKEDHTSRSRASRSSNNRGDGRKHRSVVKTEVVVNEYGRGRDGLSVPATAVDSEAEAIEHTKPRIPAYRRAIPAQAATLSYHLYCDPDDIGQRDVSAVIELSPEQGLEQPPRRGNCTEDKDDMKKISGSPFYDEAERENQLDRSSTGGHTSWSERAWRSLSRGDLLVGNGAACSVRRQLFGEAQSEVSDDQGEDEDLDLDLSSYKRTPGGGPKSSPSEYPSSSADELCYSSSSPCPEGTEKKQNVKGAAVLKIAPRKLDESLLAEDTTTQLGTAVENDPVNNAVDEVVQQEYIIGGPGAKAVALCGSGTTDLVPIPVLVENAASPELLAFAGSPDFLEGTKPAATTASKSTGLPLSSQPLGKASLLGSTSGAFGGPIVKGHTSQADSHLHRGGHLVREDKQDNDGEDIWDERSDTDSDLDAEHPGGRRDLRFEEYDGAASPEMAGVRVTTPVALGKEEQNQVLEVEEDGGKINNKLLGQRGREVDQEVCATVDAEHNSGDLLVPSSGDESLANRAIIVDRRRDLLVSCSSSSPTSRTSGHVSTSSDDGKKRDRAKLLEGISVRLDLSPLSLEDCVSSSWRSGVVASSSSSDEKSVRMKSRAEEPALSSGDDEYPGAPLSSDDGRGASLSKQDSLVSSCGANRGSFSATITESEEEVTESSSFDEVVADITMPLPASRTAPGVIASLLDANVTPILPLYSPRGSILCNSMINRSGNAEDPKVAANKLTRFPIPRDSPYRYHLETQCNEQSNAAKHASCQPQPLEDQVVQLDEHSKRGSSSSSSNKTTRTSCEVDGRGPASRIRASSTSTLMKTPSPAKSSPPKFSPQRSVRGFDGTRILDGQSLSSSPPHSEGSGLLSPILETEVENATLFSIPEAMATEEDEQRLRGESTKRRAGAGGRGVVDKSALAFVGKIQLHEEQHKDGHGSLQWMKHLLRTAKLFHVMQDGSVYVVRSSSPGEERGKGIEDTHESENAQASRVSASLATGVSFQRLSSPFVVNDTSSGTANLPASSTHQMKEETSCEVEALVKDSCAEASDGDTDLRIEADLILQNEAILRRTKKHAAARESHLLQAGTRNASVKGGRAPPPPTPDDDFFPEVSLTLKHTSSLPRSPGSKSNLSSCSTRGKFAAWYARTLGGIASASSQTLEFLRNPREADVSSSDEGTLYGSQMNTSNQSSAMMNTRTGRGRAVGHGTTRLQRCGQCRKYYQYLEGVDERCRNCGARPTTGSFGLGFAELLPPQ